MPTMNDFLRYDAIRPTCQELGIGEEIKPDRSICWFEITDGNQDDPTFAYCGFMPAHGGPHGEWQH